MFYYGKLVISADLTPGDDGYATGTVAASFDNDVFMTNLSQASTAPHVEIDPSASTTYDLSLPWYSANGWYNQFNIPASPRINLQAWIFNQLSSANDVAPTSVTIQIYMIMEDVELSIPAFPAISAQSEEDTKGTISKPLSVLGTMSGMAAGMMPQFAPFLVPFAAVAGGLGQIAAYLGYSAPIILEESRPTLNKVVDTVSYTDGRVGIGKLTGDPKQGVSFTATAASVGNDDDGVLLKLAQRYALVDQMVWSTSTGITDSITVHPMLTFPEGAYIQYTPVGFVSGAFTYWSGTLDFKFEVVASGLHRGAIGISWVPYLDSPGNAYMEFPNKYITQVIDLTQTRQAEFKVPFGGDLPNLRVDDTPDATGANGVLWIYEINPLKTSGSTSSVGINVYLKAGEDYQLYRPNLGARSRYTTVRTVQSELVAKDLIEAPPPVVVVKPEQGSRAAIYFGEVFHTIKQLASRSSIVAFGQLDVQGTDQVIRTIFHPIRQPGLPETYNFNGTITYNMNVWYLNDFSTYFATAFLAERGGHRWKFLELDPPLEIGQPRAPSQMVNSVWLEVNSTTAPSNPWYGVAASSSNFGYVTTTSLSESSSGAMLDSKWIHPAIEYEVPFMSRARFVNPRKIRNWESPLLERPAVQLNLSNYYTAAAVYGTPYQMWHSVADDYSLHYFMYVPTMKLQTVDT